MRLSIAAAAIVASSSSSSGITSAESSIDHSHTTVDPQSLSNVITFNTVNVNVNDDDQRGQSTESETHVAVDGSRNNSSRRKNGVLRNTVVDSNRSSSKRRRHHSNPSEGKQRNQQPNDGINPSSNHESTQERQQQQQVINHQDQQLRQECTPHNDKTTDTLNAASTTSTRISQQDAEQQQQQQIDVENDIEHYYHDEEEEDDDSNDEIVGILSCGYGQYCQESSESSLGGFCVKQKHPATDIGSDGDNRIDQSADMMTTRTVATLKRDRDRNRNRRRVTSNGRNRSRKNPYPDQLVRQRRRKEQVVGRLTVVQLADLFCNRPEQTGLSVDCDCSNMDFANNNGTFSCYFGPDCINLDTGCEAPNTDGNGGLSSGSALDNIARNVDSFEHCTSEQFFANITSEALYEYTSCYTQRMPKSNYSFSYCTDFAFNVIDGPTCEIEIDGVTCNSCDIAIGAGYDYAENCEVFDCTNTFLNYAGDRCGAFSDPTLRSASIVEYLYDSFWPCPKGGCNLCGTGGRMTTGFANFTYTTQLLNVTDVFYCYDVNYQAVTGGLYGTSYCDTLPSVVQDVCGCVVVSPPNLPPVDPPLSEPNDSGNEEPPPSSQEPNLGSSDANSKMFSSIIGDWRNAGIAMSLGLLATSSVLFASI